ncbi:unnamed protein product, partial [Cyprideis torosa]
MENSNDVEFSKESVDCGNDKPDWYRESRKVFFNRLENYLGNRDAESAETLRIIKLLFMESLDYVVTFLSVKEEDGSSRSVPDLDVKGYLLQNIHENGKLQPTQANLPQGGSESLTDDDGTSSSGTETNSGADEDEEESFAFSRDSNNSVSQQKGIKGKRANLSKCGVCGKILLGRFLERHLAVVHSEEQRPGKRNRNRRVIVSCQKCGKVLSSKESLDSHMKFKHAPKGK